MICLTFDTDWMTPADMQRFLDEFPVAGAGTFFLWREMREVDWGRHETEPHPVFSGHRSWGEEIDALVERTGVYPRGIRTHSCVYSHMLGIALAERGYRYASIATPLFQDGLLPYRHPWGIWELPIYYMDNMDFCMGLNWPESNHRPFDPAVIERAVNGDALYVFDFHPLHIILNTSTLEDYHSVRRRIAEEGLSPFDYRFAGRGVGTFYRELCLAMENAGQVSSTCLDALEGIMARDASAAGGAGRVNRAT